MFLALLKGTLTKLDLKGAHSSHTIILLFLSSLVAWLTINIVALPRTPVALM